MVNSTPTQTDTKSLIASALTMIPARLIFAATIVVILMKSVYGIPDDYTPDVTARVARISLLKGDAQIRRNGSQEWERATLNLPLAEGDEIVTEDNGRIEIQFDKDNYLRLDENSQVKLTTFKDDGEIGRAHV